MAAAGGVLVAAVDAVVEQDLSMLSVPGLQEAYAQVAPQVQRLTGFGGALLVELAARGGGQVPTENGRGRSLPGWAAEASGDSSGAAGRLLRVASALQGGLPRVAQAVLDGQLPFVRAEVLTRLVGRVDPISLAEAEPELLAVAQQLDPVQLAAYVRHQIATWVEPVLDDDERRAGERRYLKTRSQADGSIWGSFLLPAGEGEALLTALEPMARPAGVQDQRSAAQRRADALTEIVEQVLRHGELPQAGGQRPQLSYVLPADWAARQSRERACPDCQRCAQHAPASFAELVAAGVPGGAAGAAATRYGCATAAWTGPQTRARIETVLCDARITRALLDSAGQVIRLESLTDSITPAQRRALVARDVQCVARGCTRPPAMCDVHHLTARADGGATALSNLVLLCRRHHVLWHLGKTTLADLHVPWVVRGARTGPRAQGPPEPRGAVHGSHVASTLLLRRLRSSATGGCGRAATAENGH